MGLNPAAWPDGFLLAVGVLAALDVAVRPWSPLGKEGLANAVYLLVVYAPILLLPHLPPWGIASVLGGIALLSHWSYARMVGLAGERRFFLGSLACTAAFYGVARVHWYGLFQAMPAFSVCAVVALGAAKREPKAFLQKLCLSWLGLLVYGYLGGHAALFPDLVTYPLVLSGGLWLSLVLFIAKVADLPWAAVRRFSPSPHPWIQLVISPLGGVLGGGLMGRFVHGELGPFCVLGLLIGACLAFGSRAFGLMVADVTGAPPRRPLLGSAMFGVAMAVAIAYHDIRYLWT